MKKTMIAVLSLLAGATFGVVLGGKAAFEKINEIQSMSEKHFALFKMMNQWVKIKQEGKGMAEYFEKNGFKKIAVYGMSYAGQTLLEELGGTGICVAYGIDKNAGGIFTDVDIVSVDGPFDEVDAVVVTAVTYFDEIEKCLSSIMTCPIISLEDILYSMG